MYIRALGPIATVPYYVNTKGRKRALLPNAKEPCNKDAKEPCNKDAKEPYYQLQKSPVTKCERALLPTTKEPCNKDAKEPYYQLQKSPLCIRRESVYRQHTLCTL